MEIFLWKLIFYYGSYQTSILLKYLLASAGTPVLGQMHPNNKKATLHVASYMAYVIPCCDVVAREYSDTNKKNIEFGHLHNHYTTRITRVCAHSCKKI